MSKEDKIVFCTGGGCTAKLGAGVLSRILEKLPRGEKDPDLLVGYDSRDDAAVYRHGRRGKNCLKSGLFSGGYGLECAGRDFARRC